LHAFENYLETVQLRDVGGKETRGKLSITVKIPVLDAHFCLGNEPERTENLPLKAALFMGIRLYVGMDLRVDAVLTVNQGCKDKVWNHFFTRGEELSASSEQGGLLACHSDIPSTRGTKKNPPW
jgi:hypothetical protein